MLDLLECGVVASRIAHPAVVIEHDIQILAIVLRNLFIISCFLHFCLFLELVELVHAVLVLLLLVGVVVGVCGVCWVHVLIFAGLLLRLFVFCLLWLCLVGFLLCLGGLVFNLGFTLFFLFLLFFSGIVSFILLLWLFPFLFFLLLPLSRIIMFSTLPCWILFMLVILSIDDPVIELHRLLILEHHIRHRVLV